MDIQAAFEKAYWKLEPTLPDDKKDLAAATLRSIALNYIERKGSRPPKTLIMIMTMIVIPNFVLAVLVVISNLRIALMDK